MSLSRAESPRRTDAELLRAARADADAFGVVCRRHTPVLEAWFRRRTGDPAVAADLTAETLAQAWCSRHRFRDEAGGSAAPWLFGIAANLYRQFRRRRRVENAARRRLGIPDRDWGTLELERVEARVDAQPLGPQLAEELEALPARQRRAVELRVVHELPYSEVARDLGCTPAVARLNLSRALVSLRARLQEVRS